MSLEVRAVAKYIRMSAQKVRLVADLVRGMPANQALDVLRFTPRAAAYEVRKVVQSAVANAEENYGLSADELVISAISADEARRFGGAILGLAVDTSPFSSGALISP